MNNVNNVNNALKSMAYTMNEARTKSEQHEHVYNQGLTEFCPGVFGGRGSTARTLWLGGRGSNVVDAVNVVDEINVVNEAD